MSIYVYLSTMPRILENLWNTNLVTHTEHVYTHMKKICQYFMSLVIIFIFDLVPHRLYHSARYKHLSLVERESDFMHNHVFTAPPVFESKSFESQSLK